MVEEVQEKKRELQELCQKCNVTELYLFGSGATGKFDPQRSDLDFAVSFQPMDFRAHGESYFALLEGLETLFSRKVDLLTLDSIRNPYIRESVEIERQLLYAA